MKSSTQSSLPTGLNLRSGLWIDGDDTASRIARLQATGTVSSKEAEGLRHFAEQGYLVFEPGIGGAESRAVDDDIERLWRERPMDLAYAYDGPARSMSLADQARDRKTRYRIHDLHSHSKTVKDFYLSPAIHRWLGLILGEEPVAIQSLYFQYGSEQMLHRDPVLVPTGAPGHLVAAWIALEDIGPECGALVYVPGSHRLPYFEFSPGEWEFDGSRMGAAEVEAGTTFDDQQARQHGLAPKVFAARQGQVLLWHAGLRHGGTPVTDPLATRKSVVVHFSTRRTYRKRGITIFEQNSEGGEQPRILSTEHVLERAGCFGFENPMVGYRPVCRPEYGEQTGAVVHANGGSALPKMPDS